MIWTLAILAVLVFLAVHFRMHEGTRAGTFADQELGPAPIDTPILRQGIAPVQPPSANTAITASRAALLAKVAECERWAVAMPADYVIYAAGAYQAPPPNPSSTGDTPAGQFKVSVEDSAHNVVLLLGAYQSAAWDIRWSPTTRVVGVWLSGHSPQTLSGLSATVPVLETSFYAWGPHCPWFAVASGGSPDGSSAAMQLLRHGVDATFSPHDGRIEIGNAADPLHEVQDNVRAINSARDGSSPPYGTAGIDALVRVGLLRPATVHDLQAWNGYPGAVELAHIRVLPKTDELDRTYVVNGPITLPEGLNGHSSVVLVVPFGVPRPSGDPGQSEIVELNQRAAPAVR